MNKEISTQYF